MIEIKAPQKNFNNNNSTIIFLAGSIEQGKASDWQSLVVNALKKENVTIYNPRRLSWDKSWVQKKSNKEFVNQVLWEVKHLNECDIAVFVILNGTKSPITLYELGLVSGQLDKKVIVYCQDEFYRKGNVDIYCEHFGFVQVETFEELIETIKMHL